MNQLILPKGYTPKLTLMETEIAIKKLKDFFETALAKELNIMRVSAPLFVKPESGLNDNLSGEERPVAFDIKDDNYAMVEIVHSLAKWKRMVLGRYGMDIGQGLYTDMNAIRRDEVLDNTHSLYVDQWDWEKIITKEMRTEETLIDIVQKIYKVFLETQDYVNKQYPVLDKLLPDEITFITSQELEDLYPELSPDEREHAITKEKKAVFIMKIGAKLESGQVQSSRAPDYDDWSLNGDIIFWNPLHEKALELSSMGIRVDEETLERQLTIAGCEDRKELEFHRLLLEGKLPYTVGGGIGQSRICMYFLQKAHIGEVQSCVWPDEMIEACAENNITLL